MGKRKPERPTTDDAEITPAKMLAMQLKALRRISAQQAATLFEGGTIDLRRLVDGIEEDISNSRWHEAVMTGIALGSLFRAQKDWPEIAEKLRQQGALKKYREKRRTLAQSRAAEVADRVHLLVNHGRDVTAAQKKVAEELGLSVRQIQRYCKAMRHD